MGERKTVDKTVRWLREFNREPAKGLINLHVRPEVVLSAPRLQPLAPISFNYSGSATLEFHARTIVESLGAGIIKCLDAAFESRTAIAELNASIGVTPYPSRVLSRDSVDLVTLGTMIAHSLNEAGMSRVVL